MSTRQIHYTLVEVKTNRTEHGTAHTFCRSYSTNPMSSVTKIKARESDVVLISGVEKRPINYLGNTFHILWTKTQHANLALGPRWHIPSRCCGKALEHSCIPVQGMAPASSLPRDGAVTQGRGEKAFSRASFMLEITRPTKCYFEEFCSLSECINELLWMWFHHLRPATLMPLPTKLRAQINRMGWWPYRVMKEGVHPLPCLLLSNIVGRTALNTYLSFSHSYILHR